VGQLAGAATCIPVGSLSDLHGSRRKPYVYASCAVLATGYFAVMFCNSVPQMLLLSVFCGAANGAYLTMDTSLAIDTLPDPDSAARFLGVWGIGSFVGTALGPVVGGALLYLLGNNGENSMDDEGTYSREGYSIIFFLAGLYFVGSAYVLRWVRERGDYSTIT